MIVNMKSPMYDNEETIMSIYDVLIVKENESRE